MGVDFCGLTGQIVIPTDPNYNQARQNYNRAIQQYPLIINYCNNKRDVADAVKWSRQHKIPLRIRSGGHNYEGYASADCALVIDVSRMKQIELDERTNVLTVDGGVTNREVYAFVSSRGYPFPGGTCPTVGVSGYVTGGGWGLSCRYLGLGCDSLEEIELVNYEGRLLKANRQCNPDLFWACRGAGGGNFGVVASMKFRLPPKVEFVTLIEIDYLHATAQEQAVFLQAWQTWLSNADPRMTLISRIYNSVSDGLAMLVRGIFYGNPNEARQLLQPFLSLAGANDNIEQMPFLEAVTILGSNYPAFEKFQSASRFVLRTFSEREIETLVALIGRRAPGSVFAGLSMYALGGRVREVGQEQTAFFYRNAHYIIWLESVWEEDEYSKENRTWINRRFPVLASVTTGSYVNFPYKQLPCYLKEYYGSHVACLKALKEKFDPCNVFTFPQGIRSSGFRQPQLVVSEYTHQPKVADRMDSTAYRGFRYV